MVSNSTTCIFNHRSYYTVPALIILIPSNYKSSLKVQLNKTKNVLSQSETCAKETN